MILLDTCALLRLAEDPASLGAAGQQALRDQAGAVLVSAITAFEIALLVAKKRYRPPPRLKNPCHFYQEVLRCHALREIPITGTVAAAAVGLPPIHQDPCDRFIIATALALNATIITSDQTIPRYPGVIAIW